MIKSINSFSFHCSHGCEEAHIFIFFLFFVTEVLFHNLSNSLCGFFSNPYVNRPFKNNLHFSCLAFSNLEKGKDRAGFLNHISGCTIDMDYSINQDPGVGAGDNRHMENLRITLGKPFSMSIMSVMG